MAGTEGHVEASPGMAWQAWLHEAWKGVSRLGMAGMAWPGVVLLGEAGWVTARQAWQGVAG